MTNPPTAFFRESTVVYRWYVWTGEKWSATCWFAYSLDVAKTRLDSSLVQEIKDLPHILVLEQMDFTQISSIQ